MSEESSNIKSFGAPGEVIIGNGVVLGPEEIEEVLTRFAANCEVGSFFMVEASTVVAVGCSSGVNFELNTESQTIKSSRLNEGAVIVVVSLQERTVVR